jgi:hypothetical protein
VDLKTRKRLVVGGVAMFDAVVTALLRAVLDEACVDVPTHEAGKKALVAFKALKSAPRDELDADNLRAVGSQALLPAPSMWN